jgi:hypothetical protein
MENVKKLFGTRRKVGLYCLLVVLLSVGFVLRAQKLGRDLWYDEALAVFEARGVDFGSKVIPNGPEFSHRSLRVEGGLQGLLTGLSRIEDTPPLYFFALHYWMKFVGDGKSVLRFLSVLLGTATIYAMFLLGRAIFNQQVGLLAAAFLAISPIHIQYSQEIRPYVLMILLVVLASWAFWMASEAVGRHDEWKYWAFYALLGAASLYTQYFAAGVFLAHGTYALIQAGRGHGALLKRVALAAALILLLLLPWLLSPYFAQQLTHWVTTADYSPPANEGPFWSPRTIVRVIDLPSYFVNGWVNGGSTVTLWGVIAFCLYTICAMELVWIAREQERRARLLFCLLLMTATAVVVVLSGAIAHQGLPIHTPKYSLGVLAGLCPLMAAAVVHSRSRLASALVIGLTILLFVRFEAGMMRNGGAHQAWHWLFGPVSRAVRAVDRTARPDELIVFEDSMTAIVWNAHFNKSLPLQFFASTRSAKPGLKDFESRWREVEKIYRGIYLVQPPRRLPTELAERIERAYQLDRVIRSGRFQVSHYIRLRSQRQPGEEKIHEAGPPLSNQDGSGSR